MDVPVSNNPNVTSTSQLRPTGYMLSGGELLEALQSERLFLGHSWTPDSIKGAGYELRLASDWGAAPKSTQSLDFAVASADGAVTLSEVVLGPGDHAVVASIERFCLDFNITCSITTKFKWSARGLQVLHGGTAHPGYGWEVQNLEWVKKTDERLYVVVVNVGPEDIRIRAGDAFLYVQFHQVEKCEPPQPIPNVGFDRLVARFASHEQLPYYRALWDAKGELAPLQERVKDAVDRFTRLEEKTEMNIRQFRAETDASVSRLDLEVARTSKGMELVVVFGVFLITTTILGLVYQGIVNAVSTLTDPNSSQVTLLRILTGAYAVLTLVALAGFLTAAYRLGWGRSSKKSAPPPNSGRPSSD